MPQFGHLDRCMVEAEQTLWIAREILSRIEHSGAFSDRIDAVRKQVEQLARELRDYNDQFESEDE